MSNFCKSKNFPRILYDISSFDLQGSKCKIYLSFVGRFSNLSTFLKVKYFKITSIIFYVNLRFKRVQHNPLPLQTKYLSSNQIRYWLPKLTKCHFSGLKCKACKFRCHRDCESNVPPSCGLPEDYLNFYFNYLRKEGSPIMPRGPSAVPTIPGSGLHIPAYPDSSSNTSSCNSSTPSSPAVMVTSQPTPPHSAASVYSSKGSAFTFDVLPLTKVHQPCDNVSKNSSSPNPHIDSIRSNDSDKILSGEFSLLDLANLVTNNSFMNRNINLSMKLEKRLNISFQFFTKYLA